MFIFWKIFGAFFSAIFAILGINVIYCSNKYEKAVLSEKKCTCFGQPDIVKGNCKYITTVGEVNHRTFSDKYFEFYILYVTVMSGYSSELIVGGFPLHYMPGFAPPEQMA